MSAIVVGLVAFILTGWAAGAVWTALVESGDRDLAHLFAGERTSAARPLAELVTWAGSSYVLLPLAAVCCLLLVRAGEGRSALAIGVSLGGGIVIANAVKVLVGRPRPPVEHLQEVTSYSFPSAHAVQASAFWFSLVLALRASGSSPRLLRPAAGLASLVVVAVAASRVYLGVHYVSDVVAGVALGSGWALYVAWCAATGTRGARTRAASPIA